jgi:hypothetical protein
LLLDSGADDNFISSRLVRKLKIATIRMDTTFQVRLADGETEKKNIQFKTCPILIRIGDHYERIEFFITELIDDGILGITWLKTHNPHIDWNNAYITFKSEYCMQSCMEKCSSIQCLPRETTMSIAKIDESTDDWKLNTKYFKEILKIFPHLEFDLSASRENTQLEKILHIRHKRF